MRCRKVERLLTPLLDGRLEPAQRAQVVQHLETCADCRQTHALLDAAGQTLAAPGAAEPPGDLAERAVRAAFTAEPAPTTDWIGQLVGTLRWPALGTATAAILLAVGLLTGAPDTLSDAGVSTESVAAVLAVDANVVEDDELLSEVLGQELEQELEQEGE